VISEIPVVRFCRLQASVWTWTDLPEPTKSPQWSDGDGAPGHADRVRAKTNFVSQIKLIWVVQSVRKK
jgi:hypothetical protein